MIALAVIFDRQLPIAGHIQGDRAVSTTVINRLVEFLPPAAQLTYVIGKFWCITGQINEHHIMQHGAAHGIEAEFIAVDSGIDVGARPAYMRRC